VDLNSTRTWTSMNSDLYFGADDLDLQLSELHLSISVFLSSIINIITINSYSLNTYYTACIAMVDEMNWDIDHVDKKSTIQVGSFRVDPKGNQGLREVSNSPH